MQRFNVHHDGLAFVGEGDFNERPLVAPPKRSWRAIGSAGLLLVCLVFLGFLIMGLAAAPTPRAEDLSLVSPPVELVEVRLLGTPNPTEALERSGVVVPKPVLKGGRVSDAGAIETDTGADSDEPFHDDYPDLLRPEGTIGLGGGWGNAFRSRGRKPDHGFRGGGKQFEDAVDDALEWLAAHQSANGGWEAATFLNWCDGKQAEEHRKSDGPGKATYDAGVTGLALCAFLGAGYTNRSDHPFAQAVSAGLRHLKNIQDPEGCFGPRSTQQYIYNHATASLAMIEAFGMTGSPVFKGPAQRALGFIANARNPHLAWRYGIKPGENDTSVTGWMMMALKSANLINADAAKRGKPPELTTDESAWKGIDAWLAKVTDLERGRVGYQTRGTGPARSPEMTDAFPSSKSEAMTAVGMLARIFGGEEPSSYLVQRGAELCGNLPPVWNVGAGTIDFYYWHYATLAMYQVGGSHWDHWQAGMEWAIVETQRKDTDYCQFKGSWDTVDPWSPEGGRVYTTAMQALSLMVFYRYDRMVADGD